MGRRSTFLNYALVAGVACAAGLASTASAQYCDATSGYTACNAAYEYIANVSFGAISNSSGCASTAYEDYTAISTPLTMNTPTPLAITIGTRYDGDQCKVWVDWNHDTVFDASEEVVITPNPLGAGNSVFNGTVTAPGSAVPGPTRMRIRITWNAVPTPCGTSGTYGNIEDYTIVVAPPDTPTPPNGNGAASPNNPAADSDVRFTVATTPGFNPGSTGIQVHADLSSVGGGSNQSFFDNGTNGDVTAGDGTFTYTQHVPFNASVGAASVPFTVSDAQSRSSTGNINYTITAARTGSCCLAGACSIMTNHDCATGGGTYNGDGSNCNGAVSSPFVSGDTPVAIPDYNGNPGTATASITIAAGSGTISNLAVTVGLTHTYIGDLIGTLSNGSTSVMLFNRVLSSSNLSGDYVFFDAAVADLWTVSNGYVDSNFVIPGDQYHPAGAAAGQLPSPSLVAFDGQPFEGTWTLTISDNAGVDTGNITSFKLGTMTPVSCGPACGTSDYDGDGDYGTDFDIQAFFACLGGNCCATCYPGGSDFNGDGDYGTDLDIQSFFSVLGGSGCVY